MADDAGTISVHSRRRWLLDDASGSYEVRVDGGTVGRIAPVGQLVVRCQPGVHLVQVRFRYFRSEAVRVEVIEGGETRLRVDDPGDQPFWSGMAKMMLNPRRGLSLSVVGNDEASALETTEVPSAADRTAAQRVVRRSVGIQAVGFVLILVGVIVNVWSLVVAGGVLSVAGLAYGVPLMLASRKAHRSGLP